MHSVIPHLIRGSLELLLSACVVSRLPIGARRYTALPLFAVSADNARGWTAIIEARTTVGIVSTSK